MAGNLISDLWVNGFGASAASGSVSFYQPKTLNPVTVYQDDAITRVLTQPVALDANGKTVFPVYATVPVRAIVQSATGATLLDIERINGERGEIVSLVNTSWPNEATVDAALTALSTSLGGRDGNFQANGTGAVARSIRSTLSEARISVKNFGALGNGSQDDTTFIQNAINYANGIGGGEVYFPAGTYLITSALVMTTNGVSLKGTGPLSSIIKNSQTAGFAIQTTGSRFYIEDIGIIASTTSTLAAVTLGQNDAASPPQGFGTFSRIRITGHRTGFAIAGRKHTFRDCEVITDGNASSACYSMSVSPASGTSIYGGTCDANNGAGEGGGHGIDMSANQAVLGTLACGVHFFTGSAGIYIDTAATKVSGVSVVGCTFDTSSNLSASYVIGANAGSASSPTVVNFMDLGNIDLAAGTITSQDSTSGAGSLYSTPLWLRKPGQTQVATLTIATGANLSPSLGQASTFYYKYTGVNAGAVTITAPPVPAPKTSYSGTTIVLILDNQGAGTVTFTLSGFRSSGTVAPANTKAIAVTFVYQNDTSAWVEVNRGAAV